MGTVITRTAFCPTCEKESRPWKGIQFLAYGSYRGGYYVRDATRNGIVGFTPHLFILRQVGNKGFCEVDTICAIHGCGVEYRHSKEQHKMVYGANPDKWRTVLMTIPDWNGLLTSKRDPQYYI